MTSELGSETHRVGKEDELSQQRGQRAVVPNQRWFCLPGDVWQLLEGFLTLTLTGGVLLEATHSG